MPERVIQKGTTGVNNKLDATRIEYDAKTGVGELFEAVDCDIDDSGMISRRMGQDPISTEPHLTAFCDKGDCFVVRNRTDDSAIYRLETDLTTLTGVRLSLEKDAKMSFAQVADQTFYMNGYQSGVIIGGVSYFWPGAIAPKEVRDGQALVAYYAAPLGTHIAYFQSRMWIAQGSVIWISEEDNPGTFEMGRRFFQFGTDVRMIRPVKNGVWMSTNSETAFISFEGGFDTAKFNRKSPFPAHEWSDNCQLVDLSKSYLEIPGLSAVWSSDAGLCVGSEDGRFEVVTEDKLVYPAGTQGATVVDGHTVINSVY